MKCPECGFVYTTGNVSDKELRKTRREYECGMCGATFYSVECLEEEYEKLAFRAGLWEAILGGRK